MKWTKLEYGEWPKGEIVMRINDNDFIYYVIGEFVTWDFRGVYFMKTQDGKHTKLTIDSIYDLKLYYIVLKEIEML